MAPCTYLVRFAPPRNTADTAAFGVITAYQNPDGSLRPEFNQAIGLYLMAWMM
jgi:hypothetical protein